LPTPIPEKLVMNRESRMAFTPMCTTDISNPNIKTIISKDISKRLFIGVYEPRVSTLKKTMLKKNWRSSIICYSIFSMLIC